VIINETMAARHWGQESPLGTRVRLEGETESRTVVGVVADSQQVDLARTAGEQLFVPQAQAPGHYLRLLVRAAGDPSDLIGPITDAVHAVDPRLPLTEVRPLLEVVEEFLLPQRALRITLLVLGVFSLALALFGVYGIVTCFVSQRTRELGIRVALGADANRIVRFVVGRGFRLALRGVAIGIPLAALAGFALRGLLFGVSPFDPTMWITVILVVMGVASAAAWLPARRAARTDPLRAIRAD
jgi:ABC-type antimicrobial peptide transport system permease subunit